MVEHTRNAQATSKDRTRAGQAAMERLLREGDWACWTGDTHALRQVSNHLAERTPSAQIAAQCRRVSDLTRGDMWSAVEEWQRVARAVCMSGMITRARRPGVVR